MLLGVLEHAQLVLHRGHQQVVLPLLVVLRFLLQTASGPLRSLRSLVGLLVVTFWFAVVLAFASVGSFVILGYDDGLPSKGIFASNEGKIHVVSFIHF